MMSTYEVVKSIHMTTAVLSISGFVIRGIWMMKSSTMLKNIWVRVLPHINDTFLLISAIVLVILSSQYPSQASWLNAKIIALVVYILLGTVALRWGRTIKIRVFAWGLAVLLFVYIFVVANTKSALFF